MGVASSYSVILSCWNMVVFDMGEKAFILYALVYLFLGIVAMLISMLIKRKH